MPPSKAQRDTIKIRQIDVLLLRVGGASLRAIATRMGISHTQVANDIKMALRDTVLNHKQSIEDFRALENERYDMLFQRWFQPAVGTPAQGEDAAVAPDSTAFNNVIRVMEAQRRMNGLDAPILSRFGGEEEGVPMKSEITVNFVEKTIPVRTLEEDEFEE